MNQDMPQNNDRGVEILAFMSEFKGQLSEAAWNDSVDWVKYGEWLLALEVFSEKCFDQGIKLRAEQWDEFNRLVERCGVTALQFNFLLPPESLR